MPLSRPDAVGYLVGQYGSGDPSLLSLAGVGLTDATAGLKEPIDDALLLTGVAWSDLAAATVADSGVDDALTALRYTTLLRILAGLNKEEHRDLDVGTLKLKGSQLTARVERMLAVEYTALKQAGIVSDAASWQAPAAYSTDWIEPLPQWG